MKSFISTANSVKSKLKAKYGDQWTDPALGDVPSEGTGIDD